MTITKVHRILILLSLLICDVVSVDVLQVDVDRNRVVDSAGRERYFHGASECCC